MSALYEACRAEGFIWQGILFGKEQQRAVSE